MFDLVLPLFEVATTTANAAQYLADDPVTAVGGVTGVIAGMTQVLKMIRKWGDERAIALALILSLAISIGLSLAVVYPTIAWFADAAMRGFAYFIYTTGLYRLLTASGVPLPNVSPLNAGKEPNHAGNAGPLGPGAHPADEHSDRDGGPVDP